MYVSVFMFMFMFMFVYCRMLQWYNTEHGRLCI